MTKKEIIDDLKRYTGSGFVTRKELAAYMGYRSVASVDAFIAGLPRIDKRYFIPDVAELMIMKSREIC